MPDRCVVYWFSSTNDKGGRRKRDIHSSSALLGRWETDGNEQKEVVDWLRAKKASKLYPIGVLFRLLRAIQARRLWEQNCVVAWVYWEAAAVLKLDDLGIVAFLSVYTIRLVEPSPSPTLTGSIKKQREIIVRWAEFQLLLRKIFIFDVICLDIIICEYLPILMNDYFLFRLYEMHSLE